MWGQIIEYLKDPYLVARIQNFFGVEIHHNEKLEAKKKKVERKDSDLCNKIIDEKRNGFTTAKNDLNGYLANETLINEQSSSDDEELAKKEILEKQNDHNSSTEEVTFTSDSESKRFTIKNHFWYYLFLFGTELGDEIFYCSFIPFWFWNIDGAVGRRVILVWATVMTIGKINMINSILYFEFSKM